ncbi:YGR017W [Zygosaccharomyces parabailii]|uniref:BN860_07778g1_1 n=1 Tax=Zygosaccharomyces bailii (strain CLIB 213 / ATCC 58445 / CBS 680 / BCRC 21525 / NBRC 1098 / NCYC 1416 / NRRL Y-2227) TaxID=1333698 RepID=A0A8J2T513_ZYGB2|nr:YGR017W [Zygosaccharomyces parabailii]CDF88337.1 BN860_07778g1_1 [Zygosaccharomyces bailii CLIB 213]CDH14780.1 uncharacterized protein ZBAI_06566 [Zygosaccharomyces bailii ISA1307]SJM81927.1 uncharacterized protein ZBIST_0202 [Zygosaccharomyces bailii]
MRNMNQLLRKTSLVKPEMIHQMAPWVPTFIQSTKNSNGPFIPFQLATVEENSHKPRCRTMVFRDFLFKDKRSNVLTFHTDLRSNKVHNSFHGVEDSAPIEACFYFPETREQYRFSGRCFLITKNHTNIAEDIVTNYGILSPSVCGHHRVELYEHATAEEQDMNPDVAQANSQEKMLLLKDFKPPLEKEWGMEIRRQWSHLSRASKSQYRKPNPGVALTSETSNKLDKINRGVDGSKEETGLENFAIACLCVDEVDYLNLTSGSGERVMFTRSHEAGTDNWDERHVCP